MEVRPGYKQTEVGVIPWDWEVMPLSGTARRISRGASPRPIDSPEWFDARSSVGWVRISDVTRSHRYLEETTQRLTEAGIRNSRYVPSGSLIMSICATVGRPIETRIDACIHDGFVVFDQPTVNQAFLYHVLADLEPTWSRRGQTGSQMNLNTGLINGRMVAIPSASEEQRAIADALSDVDALLGGLDRLIAKKRDLKQAAMQQLLTGQTRLSGFNGEWEIRPLRQFVTHDRFAIVDGPFGSQLKVEEYVDSGVPLFEMEHLCDGVITQPITRYITPSKFEDLKRSAVYAGDIVISKTGSLGKLGLIPNGVERGLITSRLAKITLDPSRADRFFIFQVLLKLRKEGYWEKVSQGGTMQILGIGMLQNIPIPDISVPEQVAIAAVLSDMDTELAELEARRDKTRDLKQAMMQELLTGKTRLVPAGAAHA